MQLTKAHAEGLMKDLLLTGYRALRGEGDSAKQVLRTGKDIVTRGDKIVGEAISDRIRSSGIDFIVYTEEQGLVVPRKDCKYTVIFDDIDGTKNFQSGMGMLPHGTILGIFEGQSPRFRDGIASGFLEFNSGNLFYAIKGHGSFVVRGFVDGNKQSKPIHSSERKMILGDKPPIIVPDFYALGDLSAPFIKALGNDVWIKDFSSAAAHIAFIASGAIDVLISANNFFKKRKAKGPEETAPGYLLIREAGGVMLDWNGEDVGGLRISFNETGAPDLVMAATERLGKEVAARINAVPEVSKYLDSKRR